MVPQMDDVARKLLNAEDPGPWADHITEQGHPLGELIQRKGLAYGTPQIQFHVPGWGSYFSYKPLPTGRRLKLPPVLRDSAEPVFNSYLSPSRVKKWENPELGLDKVGVVYHPENKTGHIIINDTHHVPVTREELLALGKKRYKNIKLSRELLEQGHHEIWGDALTEQGHPFGPFAQQGRVVKGPPYISRHNLPVFPIGYDITNKPAMKHAWVPVRVHKWINKELGIEDAGFTYDASTKTGHIVFSTKRAKPNSSTFMRVGDSYHIPVTREELLALGKRTIGKVKLSREEDLPVLIKQGDYAIAGDLLQDLGHTELGSRLSQSQEAIPVKSLPRFHRLPMYERRKDLELPEHGIHKVEVGPHGTRINGHTLLVAPETEGQKLAREYAHARQNFMHRQESWKTHLDKWVTYLKDQGHPLGNLDLSNYTDAELDGFQRREYRTLWAPGSRITPDMKAQGASALRRIKRLEAPELGVHRIGYQDGVLYVVGHQGIKDKYPAVTKLPLRPGLKLSRPLTDLLSKTQQAKRLLATRIAKEAGLKLEELLDARGLDRSDVVQIYSHNNDHDGVNYAAAWYGMVSKAPRVRAFHTAPDGPDTLHRWKTTMKPEDVLSIAPEGTLVTSDGRVTFLDAGSQMDLTDLKRQTAATEDTAERGHTDTMNGRDSYRERIKQYESQ